MEAEQAQDAQVILVDAHDRIADEAHAAGFEIGDAAEIVEDLAVARRVERIHGEVAPRGVFLPVGGERDHRAAAVGLHVAAQGGDLERRMRGDGGDGAVVDAGRHGP